ncbi:ImmA/IrrE family metallo-endopeptidase [Corynebacterium diphtheriae bv. mitis]|uniref:ImmA/IrrE family metallo-endopeptidase n=1 Tax=Corynebacterium diphtheriae TaxID=1717 RepID=UPI000B5469B7|nr:ImmA/IrrE family metallo-endopeptidase [Corynebacterium diphtheriae]MBG9274781.1 ImmA/IrrE family metallo-endopeptidase [Corynebacterium diphtheriae bv. mitis]OWX96583.1 ImmA/IrrE family metallo-endopeptidase [Corynebacterium diphtheriae]CAB0507709.1 ImmA/IrrE family metallo-endopeptidase [Corynebacterium diphtheriae]CAB0552321.1 ImmA/IrrE family metallo-endopeptidase [Corynebacterium diphtheriae]CAB0776700.1 ImmA/IrrE family metallo-endopeptidase [Corynebacterium diphtheriae]
MDLDKLADALGVTVAETPHLDDGLNGQYLHHRRLILLRQGLDPWTRKSILAHELGHAYYGDDIHGDPRLERRADQFAAQILITTSEYKAAEMLYGGNPGAIAYELGVTPHLVRVWQDIYERIFA